jgi:hypothetical protein
MICWSEHWKKKDTEDIVTLVIRTYGSNRSRVIIKGADGVSIELEETKFEKTFEPVTLDYHSVKDQMAELCYLSDQFSKLGKVVMKRLDPTYFEVGKLVYISNTVILKRDNITYYGGPEHPYVIKWIRPRENTYCSSDTFLEVGISLAIRDKENDEVDYTFPIYLTRPDPEDAYWFLTRYDKPY